MDLVPQPILLQASLVSLLNLIVQELDPKVICLSRDTSLSDIDSKLSFEIPTVVINCDSIKFYEVFKQGIEQGCSVSPKSALINSDIKRTPF